MDNKQAVKNKDNLILHILTSRSAAIGNNYLIFY